MQRFVQDAAHNVIGNPSYTIKDWIEWLVTLSISNTVVHDKDATSSLIDFYRGIQVDNMANVIKTQYPKSYKQLTWQIEICNVVKMFVDQTSVVYKFGATRALTSDSNDELALWEWIMRSSMYSRKMRDINKKVNLSENAVVRVWFDTVDEQIKLDVLTRDLIDVLPSINDTGEADGIYYMQPINTYNKDVRYHYWSRDSYTMFDAKKCQYVNMEDNPEQENPYGIIPFVRFTRTFPENGYFIPPPEDLLLIQQNVNLKLAELNNMLKFQAFATPVIIGDVDAVVGIDPSLPINLPQGGKDEQPSAFYYQTPDAAFEALSTEISEKIRRFAQTRGFSPSDFVVTGGQASGIALEISNRALIDMLTNEKPFYEDSEESLFMVIKEVWNYHAKYVSSTHEYYNKVFGKDTELRVDIHEPKVSRDITEELTRSQFELSTGLLSPVGYYMKTYGMSEEEAIQRYKNEMELKTKYPFDEEGITKGGQDG